MIGAATRRRAGVRLATALFLALAAGAAGCGTARTQRTAQGQHSARRADPGAHRAAVRTQSVRVQLPQVRGGVPSPVELRTARGDYVVTRSGAIHRLASASLHVRQRVHRPAGYVWVNRSAGTWAKMHQGHLLIVQDRTVIWRSAARYAVQDAAHMTDIVAGRAGVAFEVHSRGPWFVAGWHGREYRVTAAGWPEMWTRSGNLIVSLHRRGSRTFGYAVYSPSGTRLATLAAGLTVRLVDQSIQDLATGTFWYLTGSGDLMRTDGSATTVVANTHAAGLTGVPAVTVYRGGLIQFLSTGFRHWRQGQVILYPGGRLFARIAAPPKSQQVGYGELSVSPGRRVVAYVVTSEPSGASTVFAVRPGGTPVAEYRTAHGSSPCGRVPLAWHKSWLLYTHHKGGAVLIDTAGRHRIIRLPATLPASNGQPVPVEGASWL